jgi:hypothetical protein
LKKRKNRVKHMPDSVHTFNHFYIISHGKFFFIAAWTYATRLGASFQAAAISFSNSGFLASSTLHILTCLNSLPSPTSDFFGSGSPTPKRKPYPAYILGKTGGVNGDNQK